MSLSPERIPPRPLAAVVDLGTNAARLAMASLGADGRLVPAGRWRELVRLGEGIAATGRLSPAAMERGLACLGRFAALIRGHEVGAWDAVATSALRDAANGEEFLARAEALGVPLRIIPPEEEARLALAGVRESLPDLPEDFWLFDIGGGSVEVIRAGREGPRRMVSLPVGVVYLTERHLTAIPTPEAQVAACAAEVKRGLGEAFPVPPGEPQAPLVGCGGVVALAWFLREGKRGEGGINGVFLGREEFDGWASRFAALDWGERHSLPGFEPGREDVALAGLIVARELIRWSGRERVQVATGGVREGRLRELLEGTRN